MYCPVCLNNTLTLASNGVIYLVINGKKLDTGRFLFNTDKESKDEISQKLKIKIDDFFKWYNNFQNRDPISKFKIFSSDFKCTQKCNIPLNSAISVVGLIISKSEIDEIIKDLADKYDLDVELQTD